jgi:hypothetical protein
MYGLPDSVIIGTAKRINDFIDSKEKSTLLWPRMMDRIFDYFADKKAAKAEQELVAAERKAHFEKHGFYPAN